MIIKSMSRKQPSFTQLFDYIVRDHDNDTRYNFTHNCFGLDRDGILNEFYTNAELLRKRQGANYLYHEILSISRSKQLSEQQQKELLRDIAQQYIYARAKDCLVFAGLHDEKDNQLHYHLIISANKLDQKKRYYHSKQGFDQIKVQLEEYVLQRYPELEQEKLISLSKEQKQANKKARRSTNESEYIRRTGRKSKKQQVADKLRGIFADASTMRDYLYKLREHHIESYVRGKNMGYIVDGKKHRLNTLGIAEEFDEMILRFQMQEQTQEQEQAQANKREQAKQAGSATKPHTTQTTERADSQPAEEKKKVDTPQQTQQQSTQKSTQQNTQQPTKQTDQQAHFDAVAQRRLEELQQRFKDKDAQKKQAMQDKQNRKGNNRK